jgi:exopolyphosphatase/guanosine-5'-triphosphate,3'-diphosphate pyrophosphatase
VTVHRLFTVRSPLDSRARGDNDRPMNVAVVDVGSNTVRLLVAARSPQGLECVAQAKRAVGLGADVERLGGVSAAKLAEAAECVRAFAAEAHAAGAAVLDVVVASPGRQAENADQLVHVLSRAAGVPARVLTRDEEARSAFEGALLSATPQGAVAVADVGGGSTQIAVGTASGGPAWLRSVDVGSLRLSARSACGDPPGKDEVAALREAARVALSRVTPPLPAEAIAVGGTARALRKLVGRTLGRGELKEVLRLLRRDPARTVARRYGLDLWRARALPAGAAIVAELQELLSVPLEVGRGGLREGVALELLDSLPASYRAGTAR